MIFNMKLQSPYTSTLLFIKLIKLYSNYAELGFYTYVITVNHRSQRITAVEIPMLFFIIHPSVKEYTI